MFLEIQDQYKLAAGYVPGYDAILVIKNRNYGWSTKYVGN